MPKSDSNNHTNSLRRSRGYEIDMYICIYIRMHNAKEGMLNLPQQFIEKSSNSHHVTTP